MDEIYITELNEAPADITEEDRLIIIMMIASLLENVETAPLKYQMRVIGLLVLSWLADFDDPNKAWQDLRNGIDRDLPKMIAGMAIGVPQGSA